jgi:N-acetylmuramic acid 6-phosphate (MurNAc-6-P) etherase
MVEVKAINAKLVQRSERILTRLTDRNPQEVREALGRANGSVKIAVLLLHGCNLSKAMTVLEEAGGQLRLALARIGKHNLSLADTPASTETSSAPQFDDRISNKVPNR